MKTTQQALALANVVEREANDLPDQNFFGDSNQEEKERSRAWAEALRDYAQNGVIPDDDTLLEVRYWITDEGWSALNDYEESG